MPRAYLRPAGASRGRDTAVACPLPAVRPLDARMPEPDGLEATRRLCGRDEPRVAIVTTFDLDE